jgi:hypothetical protein
VPSITCCRNNNNRLTSKLGTSLGITILAENRGNRQDPIEGKDQICYTLLTLFKGSYRKRLRKTLRDTQHQRQCTRDVAVPA